MTYDNRDGWVQGATFSLIAGYIAFMVQKYTRPSASSGLKKSITSRYGYKVEIMVFSLEHKGLVLC